jgi:hypothetical protein
MIKARIDVRAQPIWCPAEIFGILSGKLVEFCREETAFSDCLSLKEE